MQQTKRVCNKRDKSNEKIKNNRNISPTHNKYFSLFRLFGYITVDKQIVRVDAGLLYFLR